MNTDMPRFVIEPHVRRALRGPSDSVRDGWTLTDSLCDVSRRFDTRREAKQRVDVVLQRESAARERAADAVGVRWDDCDRWAVEVSLVVPGERPIMVGIVNGRRGQPERIVPRWLDAIGFPPLERVT